MAYTGFHQYHASAQALTAPNGMDLSQATHPKRIPPSDPDPDEKTGKSVVQKVMFVVTAALAGVALNVVCDSIHEKAQQECLNQRSPDYIFSPISDHYWVAQKKGANSTMRVIARGYGPLSVESDAFTGNPYYGPESIKQFAQAVQSCTDPESESAPRRPTPVTLAQKFIGTTGGGIFKQATAFPGQ